MKSEPREKTRKTAERPNAANIKPSWSLSLRHEARHTVLTTIDHFELVIGPGRFISGLAKAQTALNLDPAPGSLGLKLASLLSA